MAEGEGRGGKDDMVLGCFSHAFKTCHFHLQETSTREYIPCTINENEKCDSETSLESCTFESMSE